MFVEIMLNIGRLVVCHSFGYKQFFEAFMEAIEQSLLSGAEIRIITALSWNLHRQGMQRNAT